MKLSIIIPLYNQRFYTKSILEQIPRCVKTEDYEVIIIDNCSEDETKDFFLDIDNVSNIVKIKNLQYLRQDENIFVNPAWNLWVKKANWEYIMIINNDLELTEWFDIPLIEWLVDNVMVTSPMYTEWDKAFDGRWYKLNKFNPLNICWHCFCMRKEDWIPIPEEIKIWFGDNRIYEWMIRKNKIEMPMFNSKIHHWWSKTVNVRSPLIENRISKDRMQRELIKKRGL